MQNSPTALPCFSARLWLKSCAVMFLAAAVPALVASEANAKTPGSTYCFYKKCHRVKTLAETRAMIGREHSLPASFYDDCKADRYNPCGLTSSGEVFRPNAPDNAASPIYPDGTKLLVWSPETKQALVLRINNAGPYWGNRTLDVSRSAAEKLGFKKRGVANLKARVLEAPSKAEATYRKGRRYAPVAGDIGQYSSAGAAHAAMNSVQMVASATLAPFNGSTLPSNLVTDVMPPSTLAVAALTARPKLSDDAIADAKSLVAFAWPVVRQADVKQAEVRRARVAALEQIDAADVPRKAETRPSKRAESWSQRVTKSRLSRDVVEEPRRPKPPRAAAVSKSRLLPTNAARLERNVKPKLVAQAATSAAAKAVFTKKLAGAAADSVSKTLTKQASKAALKTPIYGAAANATLDALRPVANSAKPKVKQAAVKPVLKTSALIVARGKPRA